MIIPVIILTIIVVHLVNKSYDKKKVEEERARKQLEYEMSLPAQGNLPLQYMYTIDEWYRLRCEFDIEIEPVWEEYKAEKIDRAEYKEACRKAVQNIIPEQYYFRFPSLLRYGCYCAAMKIMDCGYAPGYIKTNDITVGEMKNRSYEPLTYRYGRNYDRNYWMACAPVYRTFIDMYPIGQVMDFMGCGRMTSKGWIPTMREDADCCYYYGWPYTTKDIRRKEAIDALVARGFDGFKYTNEPERHFNGLSDEEIKKKYEFVIYKPDMERVDYSVECPLFVNSAHYEGTVNGYDGKGNHPMLRTID